jgi:uncharacterized protein with HEPN domain
MSSRDKACLLAALDAIERIDQYVTGIFSPEEYYRSAVVFDATLMNFINIGEMADRVSTELKEKHSRVDWQKMKDFRNLVAHDYLGVDAEEVWQIIKNDLPYLKKEIKSILTALDQE